jgi:hypothetical protein
MKISCLYLISSKAFPFGKIDEGRLFVGLRERLGGESLKNVFNE